MRYLAWIWAVVCESEEQASPEPHEGQTQALASLIAMSQPSELLTTDAQLLSTDSNS